MKHLVCIPDTGTTIPLQTRGLLATVTKAIPLWGRQL